ncbi:anti-sigma factor family protein [Sphingomonas tabacisoli]|uniref:Anti-sigma factor family protein n=1 Tax=Sphingomonas tabacisoli TaxID=2249466 RepID=A0ABW4I445_9SPHN
MTIDRERLGAYVDGELGEIERRRFEADLAADPALAQQVEAERRLRTLLKARFDPIAEQTVPDRLIAAVREGAAVTPLPTRKSWGVPQWAAIAASLVVGIVGGQALRPHGEIAERGGALVASGSLGRALETQLASIQAPGAEVRIGLTFKDHQGAWCRSFEKAALQGIACRGADGWSLRQTMAGASAATEYRQADSGALAAAAQGMAGGEPLDAEQERRVITARWRR